MTKSPRKNVSDVEMELGAACMPSGHASDRATVTALLTDHSHRDTAVQKKIGTHDNNKKYTDSKKKRYILFI